MLAHIRLENFKASRDISVRLAPLTVLAGLNSSGKSTLLQAIGALRQSYGPDEKTGGLLLSGDLVQLGKFGDLLTEGATGDRVSIELREDAGAFRWTFGGATGAYQLPFAEAPKTLPTFLRSPHFQFLQADRIVPRTLFPQAPQLARERGFLGARGEYTADFLETEARRHVPTKRTFPREGLGVTEELLRKVAPTEALLDQVAGWFQQLSPGARIYANSVGGTDDVLLQYRFDGRSKDVGSNFYRPTNVGFGLTYSLPIIVACLAAQPNALLLLENPEAHLHPQGQTALGELIARASSDGVQIIVETHSDHMLNGVRLAVKHGLIRNEDVVLHFFSRPVETGEAEVQSPAMLKNGRLSNWPSGFFDQWDRAIDALLE